MSDTLTLREAFDQYLAPDVRMRARATQDGYRRAIRSWEAIIGHTDVRTLDDRTVSQFRDALTDSGLSPSTVRGRFRYLHAILNRLAPAHPHNRRGLGIIPRVPFCALPKVERKFPRTASMEELSRLYHACGVATWPPRLPFPPADWWRTFLVTLYNAGPRRRDLECLRTEDVSFEHQTLRFAARKTGKLQVIPLNKVALAHLQAIWSDRHRPDETLFRSAEEEEHPSRAVESGPPVLVLRLAAPTARFDFGSSGRRLSGRNGFRIEFGGLLLEMQQAEIQ